MYMYICSSFIWQIQRFIDFTENILTEHEMSYTSNSALFCEVDMHVYIWTN